MNAEQAVIARWAHRALGGWIAAVVAFGAVAGIDGGETVQAIALSTVFLGVLGTIGGWSWLHLCDLA